MQINFNRVNLVFEYRKIVFELEGFIFKSFLQDLSLPQQRQTQIDLDPCKVVFEWEGFMFNGSKSISFEVDLDPIERI